MDTAAQRKKIVLVDDNLTNLTAGKNILKEYFSVFTVSSGQKFLELLDKITPDLILLDVEMPEMDGYTVMAEIQKMEKLKEVPVIFVTARTDDESEIHGLSMGAVDYVTKPFSPPLLLKRIQVHLKLSDYTHNLHKMVDEKTKTIMELQSAILHTIADLVECRDDNTGGHTARTQRYLRILIDGLIENGIYKDIVSNWDIPLLIQSAQLHDVGKISVSDRILLKPAKLNREEYEEMKKHAKIGADVIDKISDSTSEKAFLRSASVLAKTHHERWDGKGYPCSLAGEDIPLEGRLMAIADVYDALVSKRPYKQPYTHEEAVSIILNGSGTQFDPVLVDVFLKVAHKFTLEG